jgi:hypothetical protein
MRCAAVVMLAAAGAFACQAFACGSFGSGTDDSAPADGSADATGEGGSPDDSAIDGGSDVVLTEEHARTAAIAVDGTNIYWWSTRDSRIAKVAKADPHTIKTAVARVGQSVSAIAADTTGLYWLEAGPDDGAEGGVTNRIMKVVGDAQPIVLYRSTSPLAQFALDSFRVATTAPNAIEAVTNTGVAAERVLALDQRGLASDGTTLFYTLNTAVYRINNTTGAPEQVIDGLGQPHAIALDALYLFGVVANGASSKIVRVDKTRTGATATDASDVVDLGEGPIALALGGADVVWTDAQAGTITRAPKTGGATTIVQAGVQGPNAVAADDAGVYFTSEGGTVGWVKRQ